MFDVMSSCLTPAIYGLDCAGSLLDRHAGWRGSGHSVLRAPQLRHGLGLREKIESLTTVEVHLAEKRRARPGERKHRQWNRNWNVHAHL